VAGSPLGAREFHRSIQFRLTAAFAVVALVAMISAGVAWHSVTGNEERLNAIVQRDLPAVTSAQALANGAAIFAALARGLPNVREEAEIDRLMEALRARLERLRLHLVQLDDLGVEAAEIEQLSDQVNALKVNLTVQEILARQSIIASASLDLAVSRMRALHRTFIDTATPRIADGYRSFVDRGNRIKSQLQEALAHLGASGDPTAITALDNEIRITLGTIIGMEAGEMRSNLEMVATAYLAAGLLNEAANVDDADRVLGLRERFREVEEAVRRIRLILSTSTPENRRVLITAMPLIAFGRGADSIFDLRLAELKARESAAIVLTENDILARDLTLSVSALVGEARKAAYRASGELRKNLAQARLLQTSVAVLAVVVALLIGWIYVGRRVISRLLALGRTMEEQAAGRDVPIPDDGDDEISDMADTLRDFVKQRSRAEEALRHAKEAAERADSAKSEFLATMSHELRTPLNSIIGFSEIIEGQMLGPVGVGKYVEYANDIHTSGHYLLDIINDILDISKIEAGRMELDDTEIDVVEAIDASVLLVKAQAEENGLSIETGAPEGLPGLRADERALKQMLLNLLSNAVKFTRRNGTILVTAGAGEQGLSVSVTDTGIGIAADQIGTVMEPFGQVQGVMTRSHGGTGLGLPVVKSLIELHGGTLTLQSEVGAGTSVALHFPVERVIRG
jgi:signal transduction histidine kinase